MGVAPVPHCRHFCAPNTQAYFNVVLIWLCTQSITPFIADFILLHALLTITIKRTIDMNSRGARRTICSGKMEADIVKQTHPSCGMHPVLQPGASLRRPLSNARSASANDGCSSSVAGGAQLPIKLPGRGSILFGSRLCCSSSAFLLPLLECSRDIAAGALHLLVLTFRRLLSIRRRRITRT